MDGPAIAIVRSPRDWARALHRHCADYGGAVVRARPLEERQAIDEEYDLLLIDDTSSFLTHRLIQELHRQGRAVIGVYDTNDVIGGLSVGRERLEQLGVNATIDASASPEDFIRLIQATAPTSSQSSDVDELIAEFRAAEGFGDAFEHVGKYGGAGVVDDDDDEADFDDEFGEELVPVVPRSQTSQARQRGGKITVVLGASGGSGATEIAIELARVIRTRGEVGVLVDADDISPIIAQRLGLPLHPNIRSAIDAVEHNVGRLSECVVAAPGNQATVLTGLPHPKDWMSLRPEEVLAVCEELAKVCHHVIVNVGGLLDDLAGVGGIDRFGVARMLVEEADHLVMVGWASPTGVARLLDRAADVQGISDSVPVHAVFNHTPNNNFIRGEIIEEVQRTFVPKTLHFIPVDKKVEEASWTGEFVGRGAFTAAIEELSLAVFGAKTVSSRRRSRKAG